MIAGPRFGLIVFDFDGTLSDSGHWFLSIVDDLAERFRFRRVDADEIETLRNRTTREVIDHLGIPSWKLPIIARHVRARFARNTDQIHLFDGVRDMLRTLSEAGIRLMICTSNAEDNVRAILGETDAARIERFYCGSGLFGKTRKFRRLVKNAGAPRETILTIGDETRDIDAARAVGIPCGAVLWGYANRDVLVATGPDFTFDSPGDIIRKLIGGG
ncbi:HAD hydrolase-like protein [uncultured Sphingomonas sp.]|uniref:HAD hydrolase-like protein n=1 Tax=uncultured Sphingomonas sp. TaxID=158754 RepID=UPI0035CB113F